MIEKINYIIFKPKIIMKKTLIFLYGAFAYILFLVVFLYIVGFIGNFAVPKTIDSGAETSFLQALLINSLLLSIFALQHSVMARPAFKKWWTTIIPEAAERSTYVLLSSLALALLCWQWQPVKAIIWEFENPTVITAMYVIYAIGWLTVLCSTFMINHFHLFGLQQIFLNLRNQKPGEMNFQKKLLYRIVRHPIMLGFLIVSWATPVMSMGHLMFAIIASLYIYIAVKFLEERDLRRELGVVYEQYQEEVPMLIPFTKIKGKRKEQVGQTVME